MNTYPTCFKIFALAAIIPVISQADANYLHVTQLALSPFRIRSNSGGQTPVTNSRSSSK